VVDDVEDQAATFAALLRHAGHEVHIARDGRAAVDAAYRLRPDFIFIDLALPGMDGWSAAKLLRADPTFSNMRLIAVTGFADEAARGRSREAGIDWHLVKPIDMTFVESLLGGRR
jgi:CheY-like chemotaxis protein